jgi:hypothetical protein
MEFPDIFYHFDTGKVGNGPIDNQEIAFFLAHGCQECLRRIVALYGIAQAAQKLFEFGYKYGVVLDDGDIIVAHKMSFIGPAPCERFTP